MIESHWVPREDLDRVILDILHDQPLISAEEVATAVEYPESTVRDALTRLEGRGAVLGVEMGAHPAPEAAFFPAIGWVAGTLLAGRSRPLRRTPIHVGRSGQTGWPVAHGGSFLSPGPQALPGLLRGPRCPGHDL